MIPTARPWLRGGWQEPDVKDEKEEEALAWGLSKVLKVSGRSSSTLAQKDPRARNPEQEPANDSERNEENDPTVLRHGSRPFCGLRTNLSLLCKQQPREGLLLSGSSQGGAGRLQAGAGPAACRAGGDVEASPDERGALRLGSGFRSSLGLRR